MGDSAVYDTPAFRTGDLVVSPYLDDRISCAVLLSALERIGECPNDLYLVFTAQEEVGLRGARTAAWSIAPDYAVPARSEPGVSSTSVTSTATA